MLKHKLKMGLRRNVARVGYKTGLWKVFNRLSRCGRITILTLHCVGFPKTTDFLPGYMKLEEKAFDSLLRDLLQSFRFISLDEAIKRLSEGYQGKNALVVTLDDGYKDNFTHAFPILKKHGIPATIYLEAGAVDKRKLSWINKYFFIHSQKGGGFFAGQYASACESRDLKTSLAQAASSGNVEYAVKKIIKYQADPEERERIVHQIFMDAGGDEKKILEEAYLSWEDIKTMGDQGISFGCHTMTHPILALLTKEKMREEIESSAKLIQEKTGLKTEAFAYPWGRAWDYNKETIEVLKELGFKSGLAMDETSAIPGRCDLFNLSRYPLAQGFSMADILAVSSGLYSLFGSKL